MQKILLVDTQSSFTTDVESRMLLGDYDLDIRSVNDVNQVAGAVDNFSPDKIVVNAALLSSFPDWDYGDTETFSYARGFSDVKVSNDLDIPCYGVIDTVSTLLEHIENNEVMEITESDSAQNHLADLKPEIEEYETEEPEQEASRTQNEQAQRSNKHKKKKHKHKHQSMPQEIVGNKETNVALDDEDILSDVQDENMNDEDDILSEAPKGSPEHQKQIDDRSGVRVLDNDGEDVVYSDLEEYYEEDDDNDEEEVVVVKKKKTKKKQRKEEYYDEDDYAEEDYEEDDSESDNSVRALLAKKKAEEERARREAERKAREMNKSSLENEIDADLGTTKDRAKCVTVFSAKGGVGKTTIATELATYLARTAHGQGTYRVCLVDYNIDFGDVLCTLDMDPKKSCITIWAADIRDKKARGENYKKYSQEEIEMFLQKDERSGLYALLAPITHEDSMDVQDTELRIMLDNILINGGFDFVICDVGNNTRDSSFIALRKADDILLVLTQSVSTANCNDSLLQMMQKIDFDMNKFHTVINMAMNGKAVGLSTTELAEAFINPNTKQPYECIAVIEDNVKVKNASNIGEPLVFNSGDKFTKSIGKIASYIIGDTYVLEPPKKKRGGLRLFSRNKD